MKSKLLTPGTAVVYACRWHQLREKLTQILAGGGKPPTAAQSPAAGSQPAAQASKSRREKADSALSSALRATFLAASAHSDRQARLDDRLAELAHARGKESSLRRQIHRLQAFVDNSSSPEDAVDNFSHAENVSSASGTNHTSVASPAAIAIVAESNGTLEAKPTGEVPRPAREAKASEPGVDAVGGKVSTEVEAFRRLVLSTEKGIEGRKEKAERQLSAAQRLQDALNVAQKVRVRCVQLLPAPRLTNQMHASGSGGGGGAAAAAAAAAASGSAAAAAAAADLWPGVNLVCLPVTGSEGSRADNHPRTDSHKQQRYTRRSAKPN